MKYFHYVLMTFIVSAAFGLMPSECRATTVLPLDLEGLVKVSSSVVVGHVVNVYTEGQAKPRKIETMIQIEVDECLIGPCDSALVLRQLGGDFEFTDGRFTQSVSGMPQFKTGERVVLFLEKTDSSRLVVAGLAQGKFSVSNDTDSASLTRDLTGLNFVDARTKRPVHVHGFVGMPYRLDTLRTSLLKGRSILDLRPTIVPDNAQGGVQ